MGFLIDNYGYFIAIAVLTLVAIFFLASCSRSKGSGASEPAQETTIDGLGKGAAIVFKDKVISSLFLPTFYLGEQIQSFSLPLVSITQGSLADNGAIKRESLKIIEKINIKNPLSFYTEPSDIGSSVIYDKTCGFQSETIFIIVQDSDTNKFYGEMAALNCLAVYPDQNPDVDIPTKVTNDGFKVFSNIYNTSELSTQSFPVNGFSTISLRVADDLLKKYPDKEVLIVLSNMLMDKNKVLLPNADEILTTAINNYPDLFNSPNLLIELVDEPFWHPDSQVKVNEGATLNNELDSLLNYVDFVKKYLPNSKVGVVIAGIWNKYPQLLDAAESISYKLDWIACDIYATDTDNIGYEQSLSMLESFHDSIKGKNPYVKIYSVIQGFAPLNMTPDTEDSFLSFMKLMFDYSVTNYNGIAIWGWNSVAELPDSISGYKQDDKFKTFYINEINNIN